MRAPNSSRGTTKQTIEEGQRAIRRSQDQRRTASKGS